MHRPVSKRPLGFFLLAQGLWWTAISLAWTANVFRAEGVPARQVVLIAVAFGPLGMLVSTALAALHQRVPRLDGGHRLPKILAMGFAAGVLWWLLINLLEAAVGTRVSLTSPDKLPELDWHIFGVLESVLTLWAWQGLFFAGTWYRRVVSSSRDINAALALAREAELRRLRSQINPHFLFNSLNSVIGLLDDDPKRAKTMVRDLASLLRRVLADQPEMSTVGAETEFVERLIRCEQVRFEERLSARFDVPDALRERPLPAMLLQPLVENAIKHGVQTSTDETEIIVSAEASESDGVVLYVRNTGDLCAPAETVGTGLGLANVRARLEALGQPDSAFDLRSEDGWVVARLTYR